MVNAYGWMGVELFLCLSAFLFARLLYVEYQKNGDINIGYFYLRRALRIWPLYFIFISAALVYTYYPYHFVNLWSSERLVRLLGMVTFTENIFTMVLGYNAILFFVAHLWTISYEEQFYLVIPWALRFFYKQKARTSLLILGAVALVGMIVRALFIYYQVWHPAIWVFPLTHFEAILGGLAVGLGLFDNVLKKIPGWVLIIAGVIALWLVTLLPNVNFIQTKLMLTYPLVRIGLTLILSAIIQDRLWPLSVLLNSSHIRYLGKISYGLYVYHVAMLSLGTYLVNKFVLPERLFVYPGAVLLTTLVLTILISAISYQTLEKPFLKLKSRFSFVESRSI